MRLMTLRSVSVFLFCAFVVGVAAVGPRVVQRAPAEEPAGGSSKSAAATGTAPRKGDEAPAKPVLGRKVPALTLKDYRGAERRLSDFEQNKFLVVAFLGTECPLAKLYGPRLAELHKSYQKQGVGFVAINANQQDSLTEIAAYARIHGIEFPILKDLHGEATEAFAAERTPEAFVLDSDRVIRYHGRIDDQYGIGYVREKPQRRDLALALDQLLSGKPVEVAETKPVGCFIGRTKPVRPNAEATVTYANQISRLFQDRCVECHRAGEIAPFALTDYSEAVGWADTILEVVRERRMPPWHADPAHGHFANARRLSDEEVALVKKWVADGAPEGNPADLPKPKEFVTGWQFDGEPDAVIEMRDKPFDVPAEGAVDYKYFTVDPGFKEDKWIRMAEPQPGNRAVVHHILVMVKPPAGAPPGAGGGEFLAGYVPGMRIAPFPAGMAKLVPKGSQLIFQMHYTPNGSPQKDLSRIGLKFANPDEITHIVVTSRAAEGKLSIPPQAENHRVEATSTSHPSDLLLLSLMPHMHLRGKSFRYEALYPDGREEVLLDVPKYDFNWQTSYFLDKPLTMPGGTKIRCIAHYDNSENNLSNPDPTKTVRWGDQTWNEMMIGYFDVAVPVGEATPGRRPRPGLAAIATPEGRRKQAEQLLKRFDADSDGKVQRKEVPERSLPVFDALDRDKDGVVTAAEIEAGLTPPRR